MNKSILYILFFACIILSSCEKVITVTPEGGEDLITVDAWVNNQAEDQVIRLTNSQAYFENNFNAGISGAQVYLTDNMGGFFPFEDQGDGNYIWTSNGNTLGDVGTKFTFTATVNGKFLEAESPMNRVPNIEQIRYEFRDDDLLAGDGYFAEVIARDFDGVGDTYWIKAYKNGQYLNKPDELNLAYDAGFDAGTPSDGLIFIPPVRELINPYIDTFPPYLIGDEIRVEVHSINVEAFSFMEIARDQMSNGGNTIFALPLSNTRSNVKNLTDNTAILGIFNVAAVSAAEVRVE